MKEKEKDTLLEKEKDKPKNLHLDFTCNYREKNNVNYFLGFFIYRREITLSEKIPQIRLKTPPLIFPMILRYKTAFLKIWDFLVMEGKMIENKFPENYLINFDREILL